MSSPVKKVLIIAYYWPPSAGSGVQRWLKFVKYLRDFGWEPIVYTPLNPDFDLKDNKLLDEIPKGILILQQPIFEPFNLYRKVLGKSTENQVNPIMKGEGSGKPGWKSRIALWIRANIFIPDSRMFWINPSVQFIDKWLKTNRVDAMVTTGPPHSMHLIGLGLKKKHNIPWLADFRDPWTRIDFFHELNLEPWADKKHRDLEAQVLNTADHVVVVGNDMRNEYKKLTSTPITVVTNGYDPADFEISESVELDKQFTIVHIGMLGKARSHDIFWKGLYELRNENPDFAGAIEVRIYGIADPVVLDQIKNFEDRSWVKFLPYLPHHEIIEVQRKAQVLLLSVNNVPTAKGIVTGKIFEYLAISRPILCIGPVDGDAALIVKEAKAGTTIGFDDLAGFKIAILEMFQNFKSGHNQVASTGVEKYSRKTLCGEMATILNLI